MGVPIPSRRVLLSDVGVEELPNELGEIDSMYAKPVLLILPDPEALVHQFAVLLHAGSMHGALLKHYPEYRRYR